MNMKDTAVGVAIIAGVAIVVYLFAKKEIAAAARAIEPALNPTSDQNLAYRGVNKVGEVLTGDPSWSLGSWLYDVFNPPYDPNADYQPRKLEVRKEAIVYDYLAGNG